MLSQVSVRYVASLLCLFLMGCGPHKTPTKPAASPTPKPVATPLPIAGELTESHSVFSDGAGNRRVELKGSRVSLLPGSKQAQVAATQAVVYEHGKPALSVTAKNLRLETSTYKLTAEGSVSAETPNAYKVRCDLLVWTPGKDIKAANTGTLKGTGNVSVVSGTDLALYGSRFTADTLLQTLKILP
jgi:hypothetical protein